MCRPFLIAELSGNHNQSLGRALSLVREAAKAGADAIKLQTYTADTMTLPLKSGEFFIRDPKSLWVGQSMYELYQKAHTPWEWHKPIFELAKELGLMAFSTPFDASAVDFLEGLDVPCYKIASFELVDIPLIRRIALTGKPVIMSTGMATVEEIDEAVQAVRENGCSDLTLLKCTSTYPSEPKDSNLRAIPLLRERFQCKVGLSDHTPGIGVAVAATALGATVIEKHFTLSRADGGVDAAFSLEPAEFAMMVAECHRAWESLGVDKIGPTEAEQHARLRRRSLYVAEDMKAGEVFTEKNLRSIRPGYGLPPKHIDCILGKRAKGDIPRGTSASWDMVS